MKISTKIFVLVSLPIITIIGLSVTYYSTFLSLKNVVRQSEIVETILVDSGTLRAHTSEYTQYNYDRIETQWLTIYARMARLISTITVGSIEQRRILNLVADHTKNIHVLFRELVSNSHDIKNSTDKDTKALYAEIEGGIAGQLFSNLGTIDAKLLKLKSLNNKSIITQHAVVTSFIIWPSAIMIVLFLLIGVIIHRSIKYPIRELILGTFRLASGDLNHSIPDTSNDELGVLAHKFNYMASKLSHANNKLREREQDLAITLNSIGDAVIATDATGNVTRMNPVAEQLTGWSQQAAIGQSLDLVFRIINTSTREIIESQTLKVIRTGEIIHHSNDTTLIAKDGTEYQVSNSAAPIRDPDNNIQGIVLIFNNITEQYYLREAATEIKRTLQAILDNSPAVIYVKDTDSRYIIINKRYEKIFHLKLADIIGKTDYDIFPKETADEFQRNDKSVLTTGHTLETEEIVPHDENNHTYLSIKFPLLNENNEIYAICGISTDITEYKLQEEQLRRSQKMDALGKLTSGIAHDYNNMLGIIKGFSELLEGALDDQPDLAKYANAIQHAGERGSKLTNKLLAFSRTKSTDAEIYNLNELLQSEQHILEKTLTARIKLALNLTDDLWLVSVDISDLEDAIINMCINAMHAINGIGRITVRTSNEYLNTLDGKQLNLEPGDYVLLSITDTGCGMDETTKEKIFDPFYSTKGAKGTGLGLSQVYGFMERSNGAIKVFSERGHGSRFALYFPRSHDIKSDPQPATSPEKPTQSCDETLLVVDDETPQSELTQTILANQGYRIFTASGGEQALRILETESVDLVLSDIIMPNMDGYQLAVQVQQRYPHIKLQLVSGFADDRDRNTIDDTCCQNILAKPYSSNTLLTCVRNLLDGDNAQATARPSYKPEVNLAGRIILVLNDKDDIQSLYKAQLDKLGCQTFHAYNSKEAIDLYQLLLENNAPIDVVILDPSIPNDLSGIEVAAKIHSLNPLAKIIVSSGHADSPEITHPQNYGFQGVLEKNFNQKTIKQVLEQVLAENKNTPHKI